MCLIPIFVYGIVVFIAIMFLVGGGAFGAAFEAAQSGASQEETKAFVEASMGDPKTIVMKSLIAQIAASLLVLFGFNAMIKHNPNA